MSDSDEVWPPRPQKGTSKKLDSKSRPESSAPTPITEDSPKASPPPTSEAKIGVDSDDSSWPPRKASQPSRSTSRPVKGSTSTGGRPRSENPQRSIGISPRPESSHAEKSSAHREDEWPPVVQASGQQDSPPKKPPESKAPKTVGSTTRPRKPRAPQAPPVPVDAHLEPFLRPPGPGAAIASAFRHYADFTGLASKSEFWWFVLFYVVAGLVASLDPIIFALFVLGLLLPGLALTTRRLRDAGFGWGWMFILLVPLIGIFVIPVLASRPSRNHGVVKTDVLETRNPVDSSGSAVRISAIEVNPEPLSPSDRVAATGMNILAFLASWVGLGARYLYLDNRQIWRNPHRSREFALMSTSFVFLSVGMGFAVTSYRWWAHSGEARFKKLAWFAPAPIGVFTVMGPIYSAWVPAAPSLNAVSIALGTITLVILSIWNFSTAVQMSSRL